MPDKQDFEDAVNAAIDIADECRNDAIEQDENDAWTNVIGTLNQVIGMVNQAPVAKVPDVTVEAPVDTPTDTPTPADPTGSGGDTSDTSSTDSTETVTPTEPLPDPGSTPDPTNS